jgi:hypothetical protein
VLRLHRLSERTLPPRFAQELCQGAPPCSCPTLSSPPGSLGSTNGAGSINGVASINCPHAKTQRRQGGGADGFFRRASDGLASLHLERSGREDSVQVGRRATRSVAFPTPEPWSRV